jgi:arylsulfatase A
MPEMDRRSFLGSVARPAIGLAGGAMLLRASDQRAGAQAGGPLNFVFVFIDDMGWTDLGCFGSDLYQTPNIDRLASEGVKFTDAYSACTVCSPTRASVMTGKYPARLHITDWIHGHRRPWAKLAIPQWQEYLPLEEVTIAEALKPAGYATCHVGKWHLGTEEYWPDKQGFDLNIGGCHRGQPPSYFSPYKIESLEDGPEGEYLTDREAAEACRFMEEHADQPFLLYLPHYAVHTPLQGKKDVVERYQGLVKPDLRHKNATYAAMVQSVDDCVGKLTAKLDELGIADRTVVFFTSDNGGLLGHATDNSPLRAGKGSSYEGGVRVPLIVKWPGVTPAGAECAEPVISNDFYPTILEMAGVQGDPGHNSNVDGESLVPLLRQPGGRLDRDALYWHYPHYHPGGATPYGAVRARDWKLLEFYEDMHTELYHLAEDIGEKTDLAQASPQEADEFREQLQAWREAVGAQMPTPNPDYDPAKEEQPPQRP